MVLLSLSLVPPLAYAQPQGSRAGHDAGSPDCKSSYDGDYIPHCDFVNADPSAQGSNIPKCDGSYQDCYTEDGYFCEVGSGELGCEIEDSSNSDDDGGNSDNDDQTEGDQDQTVGDADPEDNLLGN
jgi:hypothetical protein